MDTLSTTLDAVCLASQMILESGGETYRAEETVERMCQGLGIPKVDVLALPTGLMLTLTLEDDSTFSRIVRVHNRSTDLGRMDQCNDISRKVASGRMDAEEALKALRVITGQEIFPAEMYYFNELPARIIMSDLVWIALISILLCTFGGVIPALRAAKLDPSRALRYE